jgi:outer membrane receptor protein involved in Fe transport
MNRRSIGYVLWCLCTAMCATTAIAQNTAAVDKTHSTARTGEVLFERAVSVGVTRVALWQALDAVAKSANVRIVYRSDLAELTTSVSVQATGEPLGVVLRQLLVGTSLGFTLLNNDIITVKPKLGKPSAAPGTIAGVVTDVSTRRAIAGATVLLDKTAAGVTTNGRGAYRLSGLAKGAHTIAVKRVGYSPVQRTVLVADDEEATINIEMTLSSNTLDQVVVTGTVVPTERKALPNAITVITAQQIEQRGITRIEQLFRGDVPGVFASNQGSGSALQTPTIFSRGATALSSFSSGSDAGTNYIKTYVDGVELANAKYLSQIDPQSIERIEILTGPQASTIYGSNAINGVMQIFTKRGVAAAPQITLNLLSGLIQNSFTAALTPQHDYSALINGIEGHLSYSGGGSWNYVGRWTPASQTRQLGEFGGIRLSVPTPVGAMTVDANLRHRYSRNTERGDFFQASQVFLANGYYRAGINGRTTPHTSTVSGQTSGLMIGYSPFQWWSHELKLGRDVADETSANTSQGYGNPGDTSLYLFQVNTTRTSMRYATTVQVPITAAVNASVILGADNWQMLTSTLFASTPRLTGPLDGYTSLSRIPGHNAGGFMQGQLSLLDHLFFTYGLRVEWNPNFGRDALPNYAPRYGVAYTMDIGSVTAKARGSYGRSTRPPSRDQKNGAIDPFLAPDYGVFDYQRSNPNLGPEYQQGGEGGIELYLGTRGSLVVTRYNQTIDGLIDNPLVDSVRSFTTSPSTYQSRDVNGYGYWHQHQMLNVGSIRNQGWELQGTVSAGPMTTRGTYSWTKSRVIGITQKYRGLFDARSYPQYQPGATFQYLPEHTWGLGMTYAHSRGSVALNFTGVGSLTNRGDRISIEYLSHDIRLQQNLQNVGYPGYVSFGRAYAMADLTASHNVTRHIVGVLQIQNLTNHYVNDFDARYATLGRQSKAGFRVRY